MDDFRAFVKEAHARGLRVITELVINHTSDQHPWFQRARKAPAGSSERDFYVWSETNQKYEGTRIIFSDTETSNWTWDSEAGAYYWHRFFSHQPDLNFEHPEVMEEVLRAMYFWLDAGVDGLRLDAVPYLCEREGTNNENLPETHAILKRIRAALDAKYENRLLLAEANQWPEDVMHYFGDGDECHMAFHFPLMPRIYMAVAQEDRHPITDIMYQTPDIPANCQWAIFLRNHDELTLEMVTDRERDYLWNFYAADKRARINFGIRRRLAPLMENDRRKIELLNGLLMSMPGTPILYYGDELGMGDNIFLGDRNGVRTPMQWSPDRNGGFSFADPAQLYLPAIMDPIYGFQSINVESQRRVQNSLLNWTKNIISVARATHVFGRGTLRFMTPSNRKVLAYIREFEGERILCVANLSRSPQAVELDLREFKGAVPLEMLGKSEFPAIGELPYLLTLAPYGFFWFSIAEKKGEAAPISLPELLTLVLPQPGAGGMLADRAKRTLEKQLLPHFLLKQRWYKGKNEGPATAEIMHNFEIAPDQHVVIVKNTPDSGVASYYVLGMGIAWENMTSDPAVKFAQTALSRARRVNKVGVLYESSADEPFVTALLAGLFESKLFPQEGATLNFYYEGEILAPEPAPAIKALGADQSNSSIGVADKLILKVIRQPFAGINPEEEMGRFLTVVSPFARTPQLIGGFAVEGLEAEPITIGLVQEMVRNQGDGWRMTLEYLERFITDTHWLDMDPAGAAEQFGYYAPLAKQLGMRTAELHNALDHTSGDAAFDPEPVGQPDREAWLDDALRSAKTAMENVRHALPQFSDSAREMAERFLASENVIESLLGALLPADIATPKTRIHGDYHLGQVLLAHNDFYIIDFEGEPSRSLAERRAKHTPFKDVAGMLRSFDYAAASAARNAHLAADKGSAQIGGFMDAWRKVATDSFMEGYNETIRSHDKPDAQEAIIRFFTLSKALYEIIYESQQRPDWVEIPLKGVLALLEGETA